MILRKKDNNTINWGQQSKISKYWRMGKEMFVGIIYYDKKGKSKFIEIK